jgi:hypothetical protein
MYTVKEPYYLARANDIFVLVCRKEDIGLKKEHNKTKTEATNKGKDTSKGNSNQGQRQRY